MGESNTSIPVPPRPREPWGSWSSLFQQCVDPVFLISRRGQLRYVNPAWEAHTGKAAESVRGLYCLPRKKKGTLPQRILLQTLAPPREVMEGRALAVRRPLPPNKLGPPWWDINFIPLLNGDELMGVLGFIRVINQSTDPAGEICFTEAMVALRQRTAARFSFDLLQSETASMRRVEAQARLAAQSRTPVWLAGEPGTGKQTLARIIHFQGVTREKTFVCLDARGLQPFMLRKILFGDAGQAGARLGTVFVKDPEYLPSDLQMELLEWIEEDDDPPRLIVGTCDVNGEALRSGRIVDEFHVACNVLEIRLPALRDRLADLPRLATDFMRRNIPDGAAISMQVLDALAHHSWPRNIQELHDVLREARGAQKEGSSLYESLPLSLRVGPAPVSLQPERKLDEVLEEVESRLIRRALKKSKGNKSEAAEMLGVPRARLLRRIEMLKILEQA